MTPMRFLIVVLCGFVAASTSLGCGGATIPAPPEGAKAGPPPGTSPDMTKIVDPKAKKK